MAVYSEPDSRKKTLRGLVIIDLVYFLFFASVGIFISFINIYYRSIGLSGTEIGWISAVIPLVAMVSGPLWGYLNDRYQRIKGLLIITTIGSTVFLVGVLLTRNFLVLLFLSGMYSFFNSSMMPLIDTLNLQWLGPHPEQYGRQRVWGSIGFIITTWCVGYIFEKLGLLWIFPSYAIVNGFLLLVLFFLSNRAVILESHSKNAGIRQLLSKPAWLVFALGIVLLNIGYRGITAFLGVAIRDMGGSNALVGTSASIGAISELPLMFFSAILIQKIGLRRLILGASLAFALRFFLYAIMPDTSWIIPVSLLHGLSFGMFWIAAVVVAKRLAPESMTATSQNLLMVFMSFSGIVSSIASGWLYDRYDSSILFGLYTLLSLLSFVLFRQSVKS